MRTQLIKPNFIFHPIDGGRWHPSTHFPPFKGLPGRPVACSDKNTCCIPEIRHGRRPQSGSYW